MRGGGTGESSTRRLLGDREPAWTRSLEASGRDQFGEERPLDRPAEPLPHFVLMREHRRANADEDELGEGLFLIRFPRFVPHLIPSRELARVAVTAFAVIDRNVARNDSPHALELLAHLAECRRLKAELALDVVDLRRSRGSKMPDEP